MQSDLQSVAMSVTRAVPFGHDLPKTAPWHVLYRSGMAFELVSQRGERSMMLLTRPGRAAPSLIEAMARLDDLGMVVSFTVRVGPGGTIRIASLTISPQGT